MYLIAFECAVKNETMRLALSKAIVNRLKSQLKSSYQTNQRAFDMKIHLNGEPFEAEHKLTIAALLASMDVGTKRYAIEVNEMIIPRSEHEKHLLQDGDQVEIVVAIGGG